MNSCASRSYRRIAGLVADDLDDEGEERNGKDEGREQQVELRDRPDGHTAPNDGKSPVLGLLVDLCLGLRLRVDSLVCQSRGAGRWIHGRGRGAVRLLVLAVRQERGDQHNAGEYHHTGDGAEHEQQFAVHRAVRHAASLTWCPPACPPELQRRRKLERRVPAVRAGALARRRRSPICPREGSASGTRPSALSRS